MQKVNFEVLVSFDDLSFDKQEELLKEVKESLVCDEETMKTITEQVEVIEESGVKVKHKDLMDLQMDKVALGSLESFRTYLNVEVNIKLQEE